MKTDGNQCTRCGEQKHRGRCKRKDATTTETGEPTTAPEQDGPRLEVAPTHGLRAALAGTDLCIEQDRFDPNDNTLYTHSLHLAPHEARQLIDWINELVEAA
jgi:hypothetical protein